MSQLEMSDYLFGAATAFSSSREFLRGLRPEVLQRDPPVHELNLGPLFVRGVYSENPTVRFSRSALPEEPDAPPDDTQELR
eukprot:3902404-Prymnesium_polylepis.1